MRQFELFEDICRRLERIEKIIETRTARQRRDAVQTETALRTSFYTFMEDMVTKLKGSGNIRTAETYLAALNSFRKFRNGRGITLDEIDPSIMTAYELWLEECGISHNSSSFYMRNLRAAYNKAVQQGLTAQRYPFRYVYTGVERTHKRAVPLETIRRLRDLDLTASGAAGFARDMFMLSFYTRGMPFIDLAFLKKSDLEDGILTYRRRKTGQRLQIKWENCMQKIVSRYSSGTSPYLLPIIMNPGADERAQYLRAAGSINRHLKAIGRSLGLPAPLTMYVARHAWASAARSKNIPLPVISEGMGHGSDTTTRIYLASLDNTIIDETNSMILGSL